MTVYFKSFISILLFLTVLIQLFTFVSTMEKIVYIGIIIPILLQRIWFGYWINYTNNKVFWINILFSILFIIASVFALDIFIMMKDLVSSSEISQTSWLNVFLLMMNRCLYFFAVLYLWNSSSWMRDCKLLYYIFNILRAFYTIIAIPVILWFFYMLLINTIII